MEDLKLKDLNLSLEESRYKIEFKRMLSKSLKNKKKAKITNNKSSLKIKKE